MRLQSASNTFPCQEKQYDLLSSLSKSEREKFQPMKVTKSTNRDTFKILIFVVTRAIIFTKILNRNIAKANGSKQRDYHNKKRSPFRSPMQQ